MVKMNFTDNQTAFGYALYMIATSYFNKAVCNNKMLERNLLLQYKEQKLERQYEMEDICIKYMDKLITAFPDKLYDQDVRVTLNRINDKIYVVISGMDYSLVFHGKYAGNKSKITCSYVPAEQSA